MVQLDIEYENIHTLVHRITDKIKIICDNLKGVYKSSKSGHPFSVDKFRNIDGYFAQMNIEGLSNLPIKNRNIASRYVASMVTFSVVAFYLACCVWILHQYVKMNHFVKQLL